MNAAETGGSPFDQMTAALGSAFARVVGLLLSFWTAGTDPSIHRGPSIAQQVHAYTGPLTVTAATVGVVVAGLRMAVTSSRAGEPARDLLRGLAVLALVWWGGAFAIDVVGGAVDDAARRVLAAAGSGPGRVENLQTVLTSLAVTDPGLIFLISLLGAVSGLAQFVILLLREPALALLAGALPIAAGAAVSGLGLAAVKRLVAWALALTVYPFVAALGYAAALSAMGTAGDLSGVVAGISLVTLGIVGLPVLIRLLGPAVEATVSGRRDDAASGVALASGAVPLSGGGRFAVAIGPPSDAGPQTRPGLLAPTGSGLADTDHRPDLVERSPALPPAPAIPALTSPALTGPASAPAAAAGSEAEPASTAGAAIGGGE